MVRPNRDTEIPLTIEKAGRGVLMFVPLTINGKTYRFIFDTGAGSTFISKRFADEIGIGSYAIYSILKELLLMEQAKVECWIV